MAIELAVNQRVRPVSVPARKILKKTKIFQKAIDIKDDFNVILYS